MLVTGEAGLQAGFADARAGLADLRRAGWLLNASQEAYAVGTSLASGPPGSVWRLSRLVAVHARDQAARDDSARLALRWEAIGPAGEPFPALNADITLTPAGDHATTLALVGVYRPPPGNHGNADDQATTRRAATATIQAFLGRIATAISVPALVDERDDGLTGERGFGPPANPAL